MSEVFFSFPSLLAAVLALNEDQYQGKILKLYLVCIHFLSSVSSFQCAEIVVFSPTGWYTLLLFEFLCQSSTKCNNNVDQWRLTCRVRPSWKCHPYCLSSRLCCLSCCPSTSVVPAFRTLPPPEQTCAFAELLSTSLSSTPKHRPGRLIEIKDQEREFGSRQSRRYRRGTSL